MRARTNALENAANDDAAPANRRRHPRAGAAFNCVVVVGAARRFGAVEGLSRSGARLVGVDVILGARIALEVALPDGVVFLAADVVRTEGLSAGVAFDGVTDTDLARLDRVVADTREVPRTRAAVLVVDDSHAIRAAMAGEMRALGLHAAVAGDALEAVRRLEDPDQDIEIAIVDACLDGDDIQGAELLAFLAAEYPHVRRVVMSGCVKGDALAAAALAGQCHATLAKPWRRLELVRAIADASAPTELAVR